MNGAAFPGRSLNSTRTLTNAIAWPEVFVLISLGVLAVAAHGIMHWPLQLPGHTGLVWMALLVGGRSMSQFRWAGSLTSIGAAGASVLPLWGFDDPFICLVYLLPGVIMDLCYLGARPFGLQQKGWFLVILAGVAHASKPLLRVGISTALGWPYGSLLYGLVYPLGMHVVFGVLGGLVAIGALWAINRKWGNRLSHLW